MSAYSFSIGLDKHRKGNIRNLDRWRESSRDLEKKLSQKRKLKTVEPTGFDLEIRVGRLVLNHGVEVPEKLNVLLELIRVFRTVIKHTEDRGTDTTVLKNKLLSFELRADIVLKDLEYETREHDFGQKPGRELLDDYLRLRSPDKQSGFLKGHLRGTF